jgi:hypothetical protein
MDSVERYVSPDGGRIILVDHRTGEVWLMRRLPPGEVADIMTLLPRWSRSDPEDPSCQSPGPCRLLK